MGNLGVLLVNYEVQLSWCRFPTSYCCGKLNTAEGVLLKTYHSYCAGVSIATLLGSDSVPGQSSVSKCPLTFS